MMDEGMVNLVDNILETTSTGDKRETVLNLLKAGAELEMLDETVKLVCRKFCLRQMAVVEWFTAMVEAQLEVMRKWAKQKT